MFHFIKNNTTKISKVFLPVLFIAFTITAFAQQGQKDISLEDIWKTSTFRTKNVPGFNAMKDGQFYTQLDRKDGDLSINRYDLSKGGLVENIFSANKSDAAKQLKIDGYSFSDDEQKILFLTESQNIYRRSVLNKVYVYDRMSKQIVQPDSGLILHATLSPDGARLAYVKDNNLYVYTLADGSTKAITTDGKKNSIINGNCDWVYEEEFEFTRAFQWSPDGQYLAWYRFDETGVPEYTMTMYDQLYPTPYKYKYPKAGDANSVVSIHCYSFGSGTAKMMDLGDPTEDCYVPRIKWSKTPAELCIYKLNRHQNKLDLYLSNSSTGKGSIIYTESNPYYIEVNDNLQFLPDGVSFVFNSEKSGSNHLYRYDFKSKKLTALTKGNFDVAELIGIDSKAEIVYYTAAVENPMVRKLYSVNLKGRNGKTLTPANGTHSIVPIEGYQYFLDAFSTLNTPPVYSLIDNKGKLIRVLEDNHEAVETMSKYRLGKVELMQVKGDSCMLNAWRMTPPDFDPAKKYPVLVFQYSGPGSQQVGDLFPLGNYWWHQMLAQKGYIIMCIDPTGTGFRGQDFKKKTYLQLGKYESDDHIAAAKYLGTLPYVDKSRIGIWGWSYGGFMSSTCIFKGADVFKMAIAVAPVTNWRYYDNIYTERYMRRPQENKEGYDNNAPEMMAGKLKGKFLLIHGTGDDNVHVQNSMMLINKMVAANKDYDSEMYPNRNHGIGGGNTRLHLYRRMTEFILENL